MSDSGLDQIRNDVRQVLDAVWLEGGFGYEDTGSMNDFRRLRLSHRMSWYLKHHMLRSAGVTLAPVGQWRPFASERDGYR